MEVSPEILTGTIAIGFGLVRIIEVLIAKGFNLINPKKDTQATIMNRIETNDLKHIYEEITKQTNQHDKQIELLIEINTTLKNKL